MAMLPIILTLMAWAAVLLLTEFLWHRKLLRGEYARKTVHILISISIAFTPYYLSWEQLQWLGILGLIGAVIARTSGLFRSTYDVNRKSWGDILGPMAILSVIFLEPPAIVFVAVMLNTGLADGVAAIVGTRYGRGNRYKVLGYTKSVAGTFAFFLTSLVATAGLIQFGGAGTFVSLWPLLILLPVTTTVVENVGVYGIDNVLITAATVLIFYQFI